MCWLSAAFQFIINDYVWSWIENTSKVWNKITSLIISFVNWCSTANREEELCRVELDGDRCPSKMVRKFTNRLIIQIQKLLFTLSFIGLCMNESVKDIGCYR